ncbi:MAG: pyridine nucleotide-disulfide oxidoreductase, partial [Alphaproteobacteria bacterium]|nr:pyridine nucleotide-disulfide oxidoreductase [Alphaproteobacteria bacterium]
MTDLALKHGLQFSDLYDRGGLIRLDRAFVAHLGAAHAELHNRLMAGRADPAALDRKAESDLLVDLAPYVEDFLGDLFGIGGEVRALQARHDKLAPLYSVKRLFVQRRAVKEIKEDAAAQLNGHRLAEELEAQIGGPPKDLAPDFGSRRGVLDWELRYAEAVGRWLDDEAAHQQPIKLALEYAAWATLSREGQARHKRGLLFKVPHRLDMHHLVPVETIEREGVTMLRRPESDWRARDGFALTDAGTDLAGAMDQANYCIWCHNQQKDSCRSGLHEKDGSFRKSVFGVTLAGCPLDEKISEMNLVKARGYSIGALAIVAVDNPICAATGHRICNDCMKACIYQRQDPVDIPQIETRTLKDVLGLPW